VPFRPAFWPTLMFVPAFLALLGLGTWQVERLQWKRGVIVAREAAVAAPVVPLPADPEVARALEFHHVRVEGEFLNDKELFLGASSPGGETGFHLITPLRLGDGALLLVNRGWITGTMKDPAKRAAGELSGPVTIEGLLRLPPAGRPNIFVPDNRCDINYWFYIDIPAMAACQGLGRVLPYYLDAGPAPNPGGWPKGGVTRVELPNDHLQYAITWYALALGAAVIYVLYHRQRKGSEAYAKDRVSAP
jgi:surfeit locus 1 family protein